MMIDANKTKTTSITPLIAIISNNKKMKTTPWFYPHFGLDTFVRMLMYYRTHCLLLHAKSYAK